jgi:multisubunit Na+/H+ antiporter MnhG subunit
MFRSPGHVSGQLSEMMRPKTLHKVFGRFCFQSNQKENVRMKIENILKTLGLPLALVAVIVAFLAWAGLTLDELYVVAASLIGLQLFLSFLIDVLKYAGVVNAGTSGKWSAVFNLVTLIGVAFWLKLFPSFDIHAVDAQLFELAKVLSLVFAYITQIIGTKAVHKVAVSKGLAPTFLG